MADLFSGLARFYDPIMSHVNYDRWHAITTALAPLLPPNFAHIDIACGTGVLLKRLWKDGWQSHGVDISMDMLRTGQKDTERRACCAGDLRALPFQSTAHYMTCLFDSLNFLLIEEDMRQGIRAMQRALLPQGMLYFDIVTERMVLEHFADQQWSERTKRVSTRWDCRYDRNTHIAEMRIQVNRGETYTLYERIYTVEEIEDALRAADLKILAMVDAETWRAPTRKTLRIDFVVVNGDPAPFDREFRRIQKTIQHLLR